MTRTQDNAPNPRTKKQPAAGTLERHPSFR